MHRLADPDSFYPLPSYDARIEDRKLRPIILKTFAPFTAPNRHSVFYSPPIATIAAGFLESRGVAAEYGILAKGQRSSALIRDGSVDIMQSAVSSNWKPMEQGESPLACRSRHVFRTQLDPTKNSTLCGSQITVKV